MRGRANLLIFVFLSRALEHRDEPPHVHVRPPGSAGRPPQARLDRGRARQPDWIASCGLTWR